MSDSGILLNTIVILGYFQRMYHSAYSASCCKSFPGDVARFELEPEGDVIDKFVLKKERFQKPYCLD